MRVRRVGKVPSPVAAISTVVVAIGAVAAVVAHRVVGLDRLLISGSRGAA